MNMDGPSLYVPGKINTIVGDWAGRRLGDENLNYVGQLRCSQHSELEA